jgi:hypothetical protein
MQSLDQLALLPSQAQAIALTHDELSRAFSYGICAQLWQKVKIVGAKLSGGNVSVAYDPIKTGTVLELQREQVAEFMQTIHALEMVTSHYALTTRESLKDARHPTIRGGLRMLEPRLRQASARANQLMTKTRDYQTLLEQVIVPTYVLGFSHVCMDGVQSSLRQMYAYSRDMVVCVEEYTRR